MFDKSERLFINVCSMWLLDVIGVGPPLVANPFVCSTPRGKYYIKVHADLLHNTSDYINLLNRTTITQLYSNIVTFFLQKKTLKKWRMYYIILITSNIQPFSALVLLETNFNPLVPGSGLELMAPVLRLLCVVIKNKICRGWASPTRMLFLLR